MIAQKFGMKRFSGIGSRDLLARGQSASEQKFQRFLTDQVTQASDRAAEGFASVAMLQSMVAAQSSDLGQRIADAVNQLNESMQTLQKLMQDLTNNLPKMIGDLAWEAVLTNVSKTAGGKIGYRKRTDGTSEFNAGQNIHTTGDLAITFNGAQPGWIQCLGQYVAVVDYPELYSVIGTRFDDDAPAGTFKLPQTLNDLLEIGGLKIRM